VSVKRQIRRYYREALAVIALIAVGLLTAVVILSEQDYIWPWEDAYEIRAEFTHAQAVTPGQGQSVTISGVKVGDITEVELDEGVAVVTMRIEREQAPVYRDAQMLLRPRTGLKDMQVALDPGTEAAGEIPDGGTLPQRNTQPDVNPDEVLASLDADTRAWLTAAVDALGTGLEGNGARLRRFLVAGQPTAELSRETLRTLSSRRHEVATLVHNLAEVAENAGRHEDEIERTIQWSSAALGALAQEDRAIRDSLTLLPGTLDAAEDALRRARPLAEELAPTAAKLTPAIRRLTPALDELHPLIRETTPVVRHRLRPLVRSALPVLGDLAPGARSLQTTANELPPVVRAVNYVVNELTYNPPGDEEGYGFWGVWFAHNAASMLSTEDAHGSGWRGLVVFSCATLQHLGTFFGADLQIPDPGLLGC
jgi:phospholipid/cholesterol/gamma-HCH transport system substrate-binding protein